MSPAPPGHRPGRHHPAGSSGTPSVHPPTRRVRRGRRSASVVAIAATLLVAPVVVSLATPASAATLSLTQFVNPFIGTDDSNSPNPVPGGAGGSTVPGPVLPFGMVQFSPDTPNASPSGYRFADNQIQEYSLTHFNGAGCPNNEDIGILPITGAVGTPGSNWTGLAATQDKGSEVAQAGYYKAVETNYGNTMVELTATMRTGQMRLTYPSSTAARVLVNVSRSATGDRNGSVTINGNTITGTHTAGGFCGSTATFQMFFAMQFDRTPNGQGTFSGGTVANGSGSASGSQAGGFVTFDTTGNRVVNVKVAISFVSVANAQANLAAEAPGSTFDAARSAADSAWNTMLNRVQATGGGNTDTQKFYTALYHVLQNPNVSSDTNGQYLGFDNQVHTSGSPVYQNYSGWDIYRSWAALVAWIAPNEARDIARSMVLDAQQGGLLPKWSHQSKEILVMTGDPGPIVVSSMHAFGVTGFGEADALAAMERSSNGGTAQGRPIRGRQNELVSNQFMPDESSDGLEYVGSDFAVAQFARRLGDTSSFTTHMQRAQWWRNMFNPDTSFVTTRHAGGAWALPLDPASNSNFTEGNAAQYTWMVTYNFQGLINLMGGPQTAVQRLDHHFQQLNGGLTAPFFYIGNEPEHGVPWAYNFAAHPSGTSAAVRRVMGESFTTGPGGLPGNDDLGATSAWYVWAAMGLYPATPGADTLALHGPLFPSILVQRPGGNVQITGTGAGPNAQFVQSVSLNGQARTQNFIRFADIAGGGNLTFQMGGNANSGWGTGANDVPPSFTDGGNQPPAAPNLGPNLAQGRSVTASAACVPAESAQLAVDGMIVNNSKWCSLAAGTKTLTVDLGSAQTVNAFVVKHAGSGAESTGWNTGAYTIETSTDGTNFNQAASTGSNTASRTMHQVTARSARFVRLGITNPTNLPAGQPGADAARIYEIEVFNSGGVNPPPPPPPPPGNVALNRPATGSAACNANEGPEKAFNGTVNGGNFDKWCSSATGTKFLQVDLGSSMALGSFTVRHAGAGGESTAFNTRDFDLQVSPTGAAGSFTTVVTARGNTANVSTHPVSNVAGRFVRLNVLTPTQGGDSAARIYELEVFAAGATNPPAPSVVQVRGNSTNVSTHDVAADARFARLAVPAGEPGGGAPARIYQLEVMA